VQWPLLMPTTLFVLINAVINAMRMVDHIVVLTRGGPDNASTLLLYHLYEVGFKFWDTAYASAITVVLLACWPAWPCSSSSCWTARFTTNDGPQRLVYNDPTWLDTVAAWLLALMWILPLVYAVWTAFHRRSIPPAFTCWPR
jgi:ABC-type sugar transport system permease subunit